MAERFEVGVMILDCIQCEQSVHTAFSDGIAECLVCDTIRFIPVTSSPTN